LSLNVKKEVAKLKRIIQRPSVGGGERNVRTVFFGIEVEGFVKKTRLDFVLDFFCFVFLVKQKNEKRNKGVLTPLSLKY
jgi:hypothetical protein